MFEAAVDRLGGAVAGAEPVEVGEHVDSAAGEGAAEGDQLGQCGGDTLADGGGASARAVELMAKTVCGRLGIKAAGSIRSTEIALEIIAAGATRLGLSGTANILAGLPH